MGKRMAIYEKEKHWEEEEGGSSLLSSDIIMLNMLCLSHRQKG